MFTGIVEALGKVENLRFEKNNLHLELSCSFTNELKIDQSLAHNGVCLTVVDIQDNLYTVTAIEETLDRTNLGQMNIGDVVNLERCLGVNARLDGHMVQGHVDTKGKLTQIDDAQGSKVLHFAYNSPQNITVEKGSICVNGVSLTVVDSLPQSFSVALIPYTWEHTNLGNLHVGDEVNLEFDILGKYVQKLMQK